MHQLVSNHTDLPKAEEAKRILIIDDEEGIREVLKLELEFEGYEVVTASNGKLGLSVLEQTPINLILLDLMMPTMNGWQFMEALKKTKFSNIPVLVITAYADQLADIKHNGLILKPFDLPLMHSLIKRWISHSIVNESSK